MITTVTVKYEDRCHGRVVSTLGEAFIQEASQKPPKGLKMDERMYKRLPMKRRLQLHISSFVSDMRGTNVSFDAN